MSLATLQFLVLALTCPSLLSAAWLVCHARDVVLVLRYIFPLDPGQGKRLTSFKAVCTVLTLFGFSLAAEALIMLRAGSYLSA